MEKLTKKEKQERIQKVKKVAHNVMHIVGYVSLGLLCLLLCLTASKCSKVNTQDNVQVQEVLEPLPNHRRDLVSSSSVDTRVSYTLDPNAVLPNDLDDVDETFYYTGYYVVEETAYPISGITLDYGGSYLSINFLDVNEETISTPSLYYSNGEDSELYGVTEVGFDEAHLDIAPYFEAISITPVTPVDNNEVIVTLGEAWTDTITSFAGVLASSVNSVVAIFYANNSLTFLGVLLCIAMGVGVVYFAFRLIRNLIRNRG